MSLEKITDKEFFNRGPVTVAKDLIGKEIVRYFNGTEVRGRILGVSAWQGTVSDNQKFADYEPGTMSVSNRRGHYLLDITVGARGNACVTITDAEFYFDDTKVKLNGPGKICKALQIDPSLDGEVMTKNKYLAIEGASVPDSKIYIRPKKKVPENCKGFFYTK